jgi:hypothetical protein
MTTKLTLRLDEKLINQAKKTARGQGVSLSRIVEDYFRSLVMAHQEEKAPESPVLTEISGVLSSSAVSKKYRTEYRKHLEEKYK